MLATNTLLQGRYRILHLISQGGMGAVYLARDTRLDNKVALKETFFAGGDAELREQFHREARLLSRLHHTGLPRVIDYFIEDNGQFLVMDYIVGKDLQELLHTNGRPFPVHTVLEWADQLLDVLTYLHTRDEPVIHRDIKPANVKLTPQDKVILLDFGLAKGSSASLQMSFRAATPAYASLEQIMFQGTDARSDLYSLAVTLYYLMTGELPPIAQQRKETVLKGFPDPLVPVNKLNPQVSSEISDILMRTMSLLPDDRPASAFEMRKVLHRNEVSTLVNPSAVLPPTATSFPNKSSAIPIKLVPLRDFEFDTLTLNRKGPFKFKKWRQRQAQYFIEHLGSRVALEMVEIPSGTFLMGSSQNEKGRQADESPRHEVTLRSFYMGKYPVTQMQWRVVARLPKVNLNLDPDPSYFKDDSLPVEGVSWEDALEFCARLSRAKGIEYSLPTEAQWEYACRARTTTPFAFGETITLGLVNYNGNPFYQPVAKSNSAKQTTPVGNFGIANEFGLYDMHGNVWEWCLDWYSKEYYGLSSSRDPRGPSTGSERVMRGGSWSSDAGCCRSAFRYRSQYGNRDSQIGFRLVRTSD